MQKKDCSLGITYRDKAWTEEQTAIVATNSIDLTVGGNTHLKGSVINADSGDLRIDTATLTFEDIQDYDRSKNFNVSLSLSYSWGGPEGKDGKPATRAARASAGDVFEKTAFKVEGEYEKSVKEGITRATVGEGEIAIRDQAAQDELEASGKTGKLAALNRDLDKAQEITKEEHSYVKLYISDTSIKTTIKIADKAVEYLDKLLGSGDVLNANAKNVAKLRKRLREEGINLSDVGACVSVDSTSMSA